MVVNNVADLILNVGICRGRDTLQKQCLQSFIVFDFCHGIQTVVRDDIECVCR